MLKVIQTLGGLGFLATAYLAYRNFQLTEDRNVSDRFTKSSDCDCSDFSSWRQAQDVLESTSGDPHRLDGDGDGVTCESLR
jgi:hypothetical protein